MGAGHQGKPDEVVKQGDADGAGGSRASGDEGRVPPEKPPIVGMIQRGGEVIIRMVENVQQRTLKPFIEAAMAPGTCLYTAEDDIYSRWSRGVMRTNRVVMGVANTHGMTTAMAFIRFTSIRWKAFGRCSGRGCVRIAASRRTTGHGIWGAVSLSTM